MIKITSFLIVNYKTENLTINLIESIKKYLKRIEYEILVFDNSPDESKKLKLIQNKNVFLFSLNSNIGFVKANNFLFRKSKGDLIILINNDVLLIDDSLEKLINYLQVNSELGAVGPMLLNTDGSYQVSFYKFPNLWSSFKELVLLQKKDPYQYKTNIHEVQTCDVVKGACLVLRRDIIKDDFIFDEDYEMFSEEVDLCLRLKKKGFKNVYFPHCRVIHFGGASSNLDENTLKYITYNYYRSKLILFKKHYSKLHYVILKGLIYISLIERILIFSILHKFKQVRIFSHTLIKFLLGKR
ncbi:MAG: glycosyltransferase family 2 protein [Candidatus Woesearchaeota archaeon]